MGDVLETLSVVSLLLGGINVVIMALCARGFLFDSPGQATRAAGCAITGYSSGWVTERHFP